MYRAMVPGMCWQPKCVNTDTRCSNGYCPSCCRAFHPQHVTDRQRREDNLREMSTASPANKTSTPPPPVAATPPSPTPAAYAPGEVKLMFQQPI